MEVGESAKRAVVSRRSKQAEPTSGRRLDEANTAGSVGWQAATKPNTADEASFRASAMQAGRGCKSVRT